MTDLMEVNTKSDCAVAPHESTNSKAKAPSKSWLSVFHVPFDQHHRHPHRNKNNIFNTRTNKENTRPNHSRALQTSSSSETPVQQQQQQQTQEHSCDKSHLYHHIEKEKDACPVNDKHDDKPILLAVSILDTMKNDTTTIKTKTIHDNNVSSSIVYETNEEIADRCWIADNRNNTNDMQEKNDKNLTLDEKEHNRDDVVSGFSGFQNLVFGAFLSSYVVHGGVGHLFVRHKLQQTTMPEFIQLLLFVSKLETHCKHSARHHTSIALADNALTFPRVVQLYKNKQCIAVGIAYLYGKKETTMTTTTITTNLSPFESSLQVGIWIPNIKMACRNPGNAAMLCCSSSTFTASTEETNEKIQQLEKQHRQASRPSGWCSWHTTVSTTDDENNIAKTNRLLVPLGAVRYSQNAQSITHGHASHKNKLVQYDLQSTLPQQVIQDIESSLFPFETLCLGEHLTVTTAQQQQQRQILPAITTTTTLFLPVGSKRFFLKSETFLVFCCFFLLFM